jgi:hypothetical protein
MRYIQQLFAHTPQTVVEKRKKIYVYYVINESQVSLKTQTNMLYDTYGEEYLNFLKDLNEILSINELAELDYL